MIQLGGYIFTRGFWFLSCLLCLYPIAVAAQVCAEASSIDPLQLEISGIIEQADNYAEATGLVRKQGQVGKILSNYMHYIASLKDEAVFRKPIFDFEK